MTQSERYAKISTQGDRGMYVERIFDASRDRVWDAYTVPSNVSQWWGRGNTLVVERMELERGGHWRYVEYSPTGSGEQVNGFEGALSRGHSKGAHCPHVRVGRDAGLCEH